MRYLLLFCVLTSVRLCAADLPVTPPPASAALEHPYEDVRQATVPFGLISYFAHPWRSYMDTWPAQHFLTSLGYVDNVSPKYADAVCQVMAESGIRYARYEIGWGNLDWTDKLPDPHRARAIERLRLFKKYGIRPLILLNSHHAAPCPYKHIWVEVLADAHKGDRTLKLKDGTGIKPWYTGPMNAAEYCAAKPFITAVDPDGTAHLSMPMPEALKAGRHAFVQLKYQPFQGATRTDGTPVPEVQETLEGWKRYVAEVAAVTLEALGTHGAKDAGFDVEVWNEMTFGSNFLDINRYCDPKLAYGAPLKYTIPRPASAQVAPGAAESFSTTGAGALLGTTADFYREHATDYPGVMVDNGLGNQWPWNGGSDAWPGQSAFSRHYYHGGWRDISPTQNSRADMDTIDAFGRRAGTRPDKPKDWYDIIPGSNFIPTVRVGLPEWHHCGFQTENLARDVQPDSRLTGMAGHGRFTHNGDFRTQQLWQTEVNYGREKLFHQLFTETKATRTDPRAYALDDHLLSKMTLRQYVFHNHKGLGRLYMFAPGEHPYNINMFTPPFFQALDKSNGALTPEVRATLPTLYRALAWLTGQMKDAHPLEAPRQLRVDGLVEHAPQLQYAGDGTPAHPHQWNRDWFAFLPYQTAPHRFVIPYYVVTVDAYRAWQPDKDPFDPARYDMPAQEFDVTIGNLAGTGATLSSVDPLTNTAVPVTVIGATKDTLTVRLRAVDYPRVLLVTEAKAGLQLLAPTVTATEDGAVTLAWTTNVPAQTLSVSWGRGWQNRGAHRIDVKPAGLTGAVTIPTGAQGIVAVRITATANGLTAVWPRWDEDTRGQVIIPGSKAAPGSTPAASPTPVPPAAGSATPLTALAGIELPVSVRDPQERYTLSLPKGTVMTGPADDREATLTVGGKSATLRVRYLAGGAKVAEEYLPFFATGDVVRRHAVTIHDAPATLVTVHFLAALHPGMTNLAQQYLLVPAGAKVADLLLLSVGGDALAMEKVGALVQGVFASVRH